MGFWGGDIFANDHSLDMRGQVVHDLLRQIEACIDALEQEGDAIEEDGWWAYALLERLDKEALAPIALLTALCSDLLVRLSPPDYPEIRRWREVTLLAYERVQWVERKQPPRPVGSILANELPGREPSPDFWVERKRATEELFTRLAGNAIVGDWW
jgi:hypothetical protein